MRAWQTTIILTIFDDVELESFKALDGSTIASCGESQEFTALIVGPFFKDNLPKPLDHGMRTRVALSVESDIAQLFEVELLLATDKLLHLFVAVGAAVVEEVLGAAIFTGKGTS